MKRFCPLLLLFLFCKCSPKVIAPQGSYPKPPIVFHSNQSSDKVWDNLIDLFAQKGLSIKIIDRSSGLIISEKASLTFTIEDKKGRAKDPSAFVILPRIIPPSGDDPVMPYAVTAEWNVRIKADNGGTTINVNLVNFYAEFTNRAVDGLYYIRAKKKYGKQVDGQSTGVFEKIIADYIK